ncbi:MAG: regulatory protein RecX [Gemmatimonadaceae bacterium]
MSRLESTPYDQALHLLAFRARSEAELRHRLMQMARGSGGDAAAVEDAILRLREQKVLDDEDFARQFARHKLAGARASRRRIVQELARKGIPRDVADRAIADVTENEAVDPAAAAHRAAAKKWKSLSSLDEPTRRRRVYAFLARRGFDADEIRAVLAELGVETDT